MLRLLPARCWDHTGGPQRHWTARALEVCRQEELAKKQRVEHNLRVDPGQRRTDREQAALKKRRAAEIAAHVINLSAIPEDVVVDRNGERQLLALTPKQLNTVGLLMCTDVHQVNRLLRNCRSLASSGGAMLDWNGYETRQDFVDHAVDVFVGLGTALKLDKPIRLFRGLSLFIEPDEFDPDIAGLSAHLRHGSPWIPRFLDLGFGFASTDPLTALAYPEKTPGSLPNTFQILIELEADGGLCAPGRATRSRDLFAHVQGIQFLDDAVGQVIFPPGTEWEIVEVIEKSEHGVPLVCMKQI
jgi:hypothetical protein